MNPVREKSFLISSKNNDNKNKKVTRVTSTQIIKKEQTILYHKLSLLFYLK